MPHFISDQGNDSEISGVQNGLQDDAHDVSRSQQIRIKNRRKRYLDLHPDYFKRPELELQDPLLYDRLVRRFQSAEEREKEGRDRGYTGVLEADLIRSEAKIEALRHPDPNSPLAYRRDVSGAVIGVEQDEGARADGKEDGWQIWTDFMGMRFLRGDDTDFDYPSIDNNEDYDDREEEDRASLEQYVEGEEAQFVGSGRPVGETGIQDF